MDEEDAARGQPAILRPLAAAYAPLSDADRAVVAHEPSAASDEIGAPVRSGAEEAKSNPEAGTFARVEAVHAAVSAVGHAERAQGRDGHHASGGLVKHSRVDSAANAKAPKRFTPAPVTLSDDRSTPVQRAVTPKLEQQHRMRAPPLQSSANREHGARRLVGHNPNASVAVPSNSRGC